MLSVGWLVLAVLLAVLATTYLTFTLTRLDRLHARVDAALAALDAQLVRRAAAVQRVAESPHTAGLPDGERRRVLGVALHALAAQATDEQRQDTENAVGRAVRELCGAPAVGDLPDAVVAELHEAAARVRIARSFYNDAVRDTRGLRSRRLPRLTHMAGRRAMPGYFDIDDTLPAARPASPAAAQEL